MLHLSTADAVLLMMMTISSVSCPALPLCIFHKWVAVLLAGLLATGTHVSHQCTCCCTHVCFLAKMEQLLCEDSISPLIGAASGHSPGVLTAVDLSDLLL